MLQFDLYIKIVQYSASYRRQNFRFSYQLKNQREVWKVKKNKNKKIKQKNAKGWYNFFSPALPKAFHFLFFGGGEWGEG